MLCHRHLVHFSTRDDFNCIWLHIIMFTWRAFSFQYFHASNFTSNSSMDSALITGSYLYNSNYVKSVLNSVIRASCITIKRNGVRTEPRWTSTPKTSHCDNYQLSSCFSCPWSCYSSITPTTCWFKACPLATCCPSLCWWIWRRMAC